MEIQSKYLNGDIIQWLMDDAVSLFFLKKRIPALQETTIQKDSIQIVHSASLFSPNRKTFEYFDTPGIGIMWFFSSLVESGFDISDNVVYSILKEILTFQQDDGGFTLNWKPFCSTACITGQLVYSLLESGYQGKEVEKGIAWILAHQRDDGGWLHCPIGSVGDSLNYLLFKRTGGGIRLEHTDVPSCAVATVMCARALMKTGNQISNDTLHRAIAYMFRNDAIFKETGCRCRISYNHELLGYPFYLDYDSIDAIQFSLYLGNGSETFRIRLFNQCIKKQFEDGSFPLEHRRRGCMHQFLQLPVKLKSKDKLTTVRVISMLVNTGNAVIK
ncbi:MAG TPA: prenyltransferase/squalene oxidase repeat-containing protein [Spirochaetota bacterium]|nr:prenyltransferase/squalene oxidase repeat-containing protein [Spirochaetota bacterium]HOM10583.1 prenyltransferase/squalene oxidase repeat-containing protein [Spirochaetota bacterium]HPP49190.1 prenyltransferase/squalene oxidase repeat-containing protein [Spirochaetota bacterium]HXK65374.1 prenyltransferase/squalene oxidase repeat-containing protein [Spirochaetota bacterium]